MNATIAQLTDHLLSLPSGDRIFLAQKLWESVELPEYPSIESQADILAIVKRRAAEVANGLVPTYSHEEVMRDARESLRCR